MSLVPAKWAIVPAAGVGARFAATGTPKQYARIGDRTVLEHSVAAMLACDVAGVVVAVHPDDNQARQLPLMQHPAVRFVTGGAERADSVLQAMLSLHGVAQPEDWVLVHDAARPCLLPVDVKKLVQVLHDDRVGGILAVPAIDTLKKVCGDTIEQTVDRSQIWQAQTPQMFRFGLLLQSLQAALAAGQPVTDEASAIEARGYPVKVVEGSRSNIKVTYPQDLALAAFFLQQEGRA